MITKQFKRMLDLSGVLSEMEVPEIQAFVVNDDLADSYDEGEALEHFKMLYELEYKYSMISSRPFTGLEKRRENILKIIEAKSREVISAVAGTLLRVFENWLSYHALLSAKTWATKRVEMWDYEYGSETPSEILPSMVDEYIRYKFSNQPPHDEYSKHDKYLREIVNDATEDLDKYPEFAGFLSDIIMPGEREMLEGDLYDGGLEEFNERFGKEFKTEDEAQEYIDSLTIRDVDVGDMFYFESVEQFASTLGNYPQWRNVVIEFYQNAVFPLWFGHWKGMGIEATRKNVEEVVKRLKRIGSAMLSEQFAAINTATQTAHQSGEMMDYYEERYGVSSDDLRGLSERDVSDWDSELKLIGVRMQ